ncbi:hypothetical protein [Peribacillus simplex]|uniref:hypothetical protein n=1 Tax=Peribacillus simplex TaxID=1478 RepID=UPI003D2BE8B1
MNKLSTKIGFVLLTGMVITLIGSLLLMYKSTNDTVEKTIAMSSLDIASNISQGINPTSYADFLSNQSETSTYWEIREQLDNYRLKTGALYVYTLGINESSEKVHILIDGMGKYNCIEVKNHRGNDHRDTKNCRSFFRSQRTDKSCFSQNVHWK